MCKKLSRFSLHSYPVKSGGLSCVVCALDHKSGLTHFGPKFYSTTLNRAFVGEYLLNIYLVFWWGFWLFSFLFTHIRMKTFNLSNYCFRSREAEFFNLGRLLFWFCDRNCCCHGEKDLVTSLGFRDISVISRFLRLPNNFFSPFTFSPFVLMIHWKSECTFLL